MSKKPFILCPHCGVTANEEGKTSPDKAAHWETWLECVFGVGYCESQGVREKFEQYWTEKHGGKDD